MENKPYVDLSYSDKRKILREYSLKEEIREALNTIADDSIYYDANGSFCKPELNKSYDKYLEKYEQYFNEIINALGFNDGITAWRMYKDLLIDGFLALEIIWDVRANNIIGFRTLKPNLLEPVVSNNGHMWIQYRNQPNERIFSDSQVIFMSYSGQESSSLNLSYVEGLMRPLNQLRILENSAILSNVKNSTTRLKFTIPVKGLSKQKAEEQIGQLIYNYTEVVEFDEITGELIINGVEHHAYNKQYWFPDGDIGTPQMQILPTGFIPDPNQMATIEYFLDKLKIATKIPLNSDDVNEVRRYQKFLTKIKNIFKEIITKPLLLQMKAKHPELINDTKFEVDIKYK